MRPALAGVATLAALLSPVAVTAQDPPDVTRPTVGLVLSGGGARGLAHIGVLEVLEELRVPVDLVTGASMGAIVGGLYASGRSPAEIRAILEDLEWERILADAPPRDALDVSRRAESRRYAVELELGLSRHGLVLPGGLVAGQDLGLLLRRHTLPVATVEDFNRLPIPYAAVAADIATGERVVLDRGDIVQAMRASMAIPVVFSPIEFDGRLLVDGGLVDNLPVSLARAMGADVIIAVDVTPPLKDRAELRDLFGISEQLVILLGQQDVRRQLSLADVGLDLKMDDVGIFDFRAADSIMARGALVARSAASDLSRWSLSESGYRAHLSARGRREPTLPDRVSEVRSDGPAWLDERLVHARVDPALADTLDPDLVEEAARGLYALGEFERVDYDLAGSGPGMAVVIRPIAKPRGPHVLRLGMDLTTDSAGDDTAILSFQGVAGYVRKRIGARGAEWRVDLGGGTTTGLESAFRQPLDFAGRWFIEASARALEIERPVFVDEAIETEYETRLAEAAVQVGRALGLSTEARVGFARGRASSELDAPAPDLNARFPRSADDVAEIRAALVVDRIDALNLPRRGVFGRAAVRASREELGADRAWTRLELEGRIYGSRGSHTGFAGVAGGASSPASSLPVREEFLLGGFGSLSGFGDGELRGEAFLVARAGWLRRLAELPPALRAIVAGGWIETGDAWDPSRDETLDLRSAVTAAVGAETLIGPVFIAVTRADGGRGRLVISIGRSP